jgi:pimeloyl-ACP methyl ester carboxylesterase
MRIAAAPANALYDEPVAIRLEGFPALTRVIVSASADDDLGHQWTSHAEFTTDPNGAVDLARQGPVSGSYRVADAMGLLWSMTLDSTIKDRSPFIKKTTEPVIVKVSAEIDGRVVASAELSRRIVADGVVRSDISDDGLVATMFHHEDGARPGVIIVGGSGGGLSIDYPALLASRGYAVMSLAYFAMPGLPRELIQIPLEYFEKAIAWMKRHRAVTRDNLAVLGASRGGELALLLGATFPQITAVVAYVPSAIVWPGIGGADMPMLSAWTFRGEPVPCIATTTRGLEVWNKSPVALRDWFLQCLKNRESAERAQIAVEKIGGPVLMFSGTDDRMWPSLNLSDLAMQRFIAHDFPYPYEHVSYAGAGHYIRFPYSPVISEIFHPIVKTPMALGGTPENNHVANLDSWRRCLDFLSKHFA